MKIILASASPRRKELLEQLGLTFLVFPAQGEEKQVGDTPSEIVMNLAKQKAGEIYEKMIEAKVGEQDSLVILQASVYAFVQSKFFLPVRLLFPSLFSYSLLATSSDETAVFAILSAFRRRKLLI